MDVIFPQYGSIQVCKMDTFEVYTFISLAYKHAKL